MPRLPPPSFLQLQNGSASSLLTRRVVKKGPCWNSQRGPPPLPRRAPFLLSFDGGACSKQTTCSARTLRHGTRQRERWLSVARRSMLYTAQSSSQPLFSPPPLVVIERMLFALIICDAVLTSPTPDVVVVVEVERVLHCLLHYKGHMTRVWCEACPPGHSLHRRIDQRRQLTAVVV